MYQISLDIDNIEIDRKELKRRLQTCDERVPGIDYEEFISLVREETSPRCSLRKTDVVHYDDGVDVGFGNIRSRNLMKNLEDCDSAYIMCVTLGPGADRLLKRAAVASVTRQFVVDAFLSAYVESICDHVQSGMEENHRFKARFAPGYGDFDITWQEKILEYGGGKEIGIDLTESKLMVPTKSITAVIGVKNE